MNRYCIINAKFLGQQLTGTQQHGVGMSKYLKIGLPDAKFVTTRNILHSKMAEELNSISIGKKNNFIWDQWELMIFLKKNNNPLLFDFGNTAPAFYKNKIVTILDLAPILHPEWFSFKSSKYMRFLINAYIKNHRKLIANSEYTKKTIVEHYKLRESAVEVVYPAVPEFYSYNTVSDSTSNEKYERYILTVSSIDPRKNFLGLIRAFKKATMKDVKLVIVGSESKVFANQNFHKEVAGNENIVFTGYVSNERLIKLYQNALFFIYPSFFEGFGMPPLEAMKCGCPTIVSNVASLPEVCGNASLYINPYEIDSIVDTMRTLLENSTMQESLRIKGLEQTNLFSWKKSAERIVEIIKELK